MGQEEAELSGGVGMLSVFNVSADAHIASRWQLATRRAPVAVHTFAQPIEFTVLVIKTC